MGQALLPASRAPRGAPAQLSQREESVMNSKPKHAGFGIALGAALGAVFGVIAGHVGVWLAVGVAIGLALGTWIRRKGTECPECAQIHCAHDTGTQGNKLEASS